MVNMKVDVLRDKFLDFFKAKKHKIIVSDSLVPLGDSTVLFTPAGMNQFKKEFLGLGRGLKRAATSQRCLRTDDLDRVGKTPGHHTFFEMLGNFSFGDYFKQEAIAWAWEFLVEVLKIDKKRLWISVYKDDSETYDIWRDKIKVSKNKIIRLADKSNFWPSEAKDKGPNGPCGPCSEIFFDLGSDVGCRRSDCNPACECSRFVEVWNLVFTQFNRKGKGILEPLPRRNIDTGMGLERLAAVMQGVYSNFETDLFRPIIKEIKTGIKDSALIKKELVYAVSDHIRAITFAIYDGVLPSNEERGYVVRKLIRRSSMHLSKLGIKRVFLNRLIPVVAEVMHKPYPELRSQQEDIAGVVLAEEERFFSLLRSVPDLVEAESGDDEKSPGAMLFKLYDTDGVPVEESVGLLEELLKDKGISFNQEAAIEEFNSLLKQQKERSKSASSMKGEVFGLQQLSVKLKKTRLLKSSRGEFKSGITAIFKDNSEVKKISSPEETKIVLDASPFYPESGGQVADTGEIKQGANIFLVNDVKRIDGVILHIGKLKSGSFKKGVLVEAKVDSSRRLDIVRNHTATHLLQSALRTVLGSHVKQQGSLVAQERFRFDFSHFKDITQDELSRIEELVNRHIWDNDKISFASMSIEQARKLGALAFFEEKYQNRVRVVSIGDYSRELCAGLHLSCTGSVGLFKIISESSVASGVRRIEAKTARFAYAEMRKQEGFLKDICEYLKVPRQEIVKRTEKLIKEVKDLQKSNSRIGIGQLQLDLEDILKTAGDFSGVKLISRLFPDAREAGLREMVDAIKKRLPMSICLLAAKKEKKAILVMGITPDLLKRDFNAGNLIKEVVRVMDGSGGGRADFAFGAGDIAKIEAGFTQLRQILTKRINK